MLLGNPTNLVVQQVPEHEYLPRPMPVGTNTVAEPGISDHAWLGPRQSPMGDGQLREVALTI